ncbi:MAG: hypothetical protein KF725_04105 [Cyclobacteriaceae bacterium]|nr:hypothetical protein [Cyclobacteriaceae bacterium]UYN85669.1 MAG: hypothetical protein KIT51_12385 [Cyclobacteriaceae bacterium]
MAKASLPLIDAIRKSAKALEQSNEYQWGHMGSCNCGFLAQQVTKLKKDEIHRRAMERYGDWTEQLNDYCPTSGLPLDEVISDMIAFGFDAQDLKHLETLSDPIILRSLPPEQRNLKYNLKKDVVAYMMTWANLLEQELLNRIKLPQLQETLKVEA